MTSDVQQFWLNGVILTAIIPEFLRPWVDLLCYIRNLDNFKSVSWDRIRLKPYFFPASIEKKTYIIPYIHNSKKSLHSVNCIWYKTETATLSKVILERYYSW